MKAIPRCSLGGAVFGRPTLGTSEVPVFLIAAFSDNGLRERKGTKGGVQRCYYHCPVLCLFETAVVSVEMNRQGSRAGGGGKKTETISRRACCPRALKYVLSRLY